MTTQVPLLSLVLLLTPSLSSPLLPVPEFAKMMQQVITTLPGGGTGTQLVTGPTGQVVSNMNAGGFFGKYFYEKHLFPYH